MWYNRCGREADDLRPHGSERIDLPMRPQSTTLCACGCGLPLTPRTGHNSRPKRYLVGHHGQRLIRTLIPCACGCGQSVITPNRYGQARRFRHGHNAYKGLKDFSDIIVCACGCGKTRPRYNSQGREARFITGHRLWRPAPTTRPHTRGPLNHSWKGGRTKKDGYIEVMRPEHPRAHVMGYVREQRLVMEAKLGRYLTPEEVVHHIDGDKENNDPDNLMLFANNGEHTRFHAEQRRQRR